MYNVSIFVHANMYVHTKKHVRTPAYMCTKKREKHACTYIYIYIRGCVHVLEYAYVYICKAYL